jgi:putative SOS response-associated peptidase YedK
MRGLCIPASAASHRQPLHHKAVLLQLGEHTRMPVMLAKESFEPWLSGSDPLSDASIDAAVEIRPVSPKMNKPSYNEPDCVEALVA